MAFALTGFKAFGLQADGPNRKFARQVCMLYITAAATDVALDFGTDGGTFWTAAIADATYGTMATQALADLKAAILQSNGLLAVESPSLITRLQVAALTGATQFTQVISNNRPNIAFNAADGDTSYVFAFVYDLKDGRGAYHSDRGVAA